MCVSLSFGVDLVSGISPNFIFGNDVIVCYNPISVSTLSL